MDNKERITYIAKIAVLGLWALVAIMTSVGVWNYNPETLICIAAGLNLLIAGTCIFLIGKRFHNEYKSFKKKLK